MTDTWSRLYSSAHKHRKFRRVAAELGVRPAEVAGWVTQLWAAARHKFPDGCFSDCEPEELADLAWLQAPGVTPQAFVDALVRHTLLDEAEDGLWIHDWDLPDNLREAGRKRDERDAARRRALAKVAEATDAVASDASAAVQDVEPDMSATRPGHVPDVSGKRPGEKRGEEKRGEERGGAAGPPHPSSEPLPTVRLIVAWCEGWNRGAGEGRFVERTLVESSARTASRDALLADVLGRWAVDPQAVAWLDPSAAERGARALAHRGRERGQKYNLLRLLQDKHGWLEEIMCAGDQLRPPPRPPNPFTTSVDHDKNAQNARDVVDHLQRGTTLALIPGGGEVESSGTWRAKKTRVSELQRAARPALRVVRRRAIEDDVPPPQQLELWERPRRPEQLPLFMPNREAFAAVYSLKNGMARDHARKLYDAIAAGPARASLVSWADVFMPLWRVR